MAYRLHTRFLMMWISLGSGIFGAALSLCFPSRVDQCLRGILASGRHWLTRLQNQAQPDPDLLLTNRLISSLRAGISLDAALERALEEAPPKSTEWKRLRSLLSRHPAQDFLSSFLCAALESGMPALAALQAISKALAAKKRLRLRATAAAGQCRAQAEVLSWLPWAMALALFFLDQPLFTQAGHRPLAWVLWALAIFLSGFGRAWIQRTLRRALRPRTLAEQLEEFDLPEILLRLLCEVTQGVDPESALEKTLRAQGNLVLTKEFSLAPEEMRLERLRWLRSLVSHAALTGAPLRDDLLLHLSDVHSEIEARWEERVQRLPVVLLAPLFVCFFPSSLLVLAGLLLPLFAEII